MVPWSTDSFAQWARMLPVAAPHVMIASAIMHSYHVHEPGTAPATVGFHPDNATSFTSTLHNDAPLDQNAGQMGMTSVHERLTGPEHHSRNLAFCKTKRATRFFDYSRYSLSMSGTEPGRASRWALPSAIGWLICGRYLRC